MVALSLSPLFSAAQVRAADAWTSDVVSVPSLVMMEHAGRAVADVVVTRLPAFTCGSDGSVLVVCGRGSNGGDGLVCARHLGGRGVSVRVLWPREPEGGDAAITLRLLRTAIEKKQLPVTFVDVEQALSVPAGVVVDAIFGTGLVRPLDDDALALVSLIARARAGGAVVVAVDVPSGLPTDGARPSHAVVVADVTVSFGGLKIAHVAEPGVESCGEVVDVDIGLLHPPDRCARCLRCRA